jgi:hypothetical protein
MQTIKPSDATKIQYAFKYENNTPKYNYGVIYIVLCVSSGKEYIGQAQNYSDRTRLHGIMARWDIHVKSALSGKDKGYNTTK